MNLQQSKLTELVAGEVRFNELLAKHTSFRVGGSVEALVIPQDQADLRQLVTYLAQEQISYTIIGNGTNLLVSDQGIAGVAIKLVSSIDEIVIADDLITVGAGAVLPVVAKKAAKAGLSGLEFGIGLPATIGGAVVMNAGVGNEGDIGSLVEKVIVIDERGQLKSLTAQECQFAYRSSRLQDSDLIIIEVKLRLKAGSRTEIEQRMTKLLQSRKNKQPLDLPNAGCIFQNPPSDSAGRLIDQAGGKGMQVGGAKVSTKHANFIVNTGNATAQDILKLITKVEELIKKEYGVELKREVQILGVGR
ncbi:MAG: UDP-N-acetylmuramate dehydrogenase [Bacillota bacterium]